MIMLQRKIISIRVKKCCVRGALPFLFLHHTVSSDTTYCPIKDKNMNEGRLNANEQKKIASVNH